MWADEVTASQEILKADQWPPHPGDAAVWPRQDRHPFADGHLAMNGLHYALGRLHVGENEIHQQLLHMAEQHHAEHEIKHVARDLAAWSTEHVQRLAEHAGRLDLRLDDDPDTPGRAGERLRAAAFTMTGRAGPNPVSCYFMTCATCTSRPRTIRSPGRCSHKSLRHNTSANC
jgi:hypothetical protein